MALYKYLKTGRQVPTVQTCDTSIVKRKEIEQTNKNVKRILAARNPSESKVTPSRTYNSYTLEERARIGKYVAENGNTKAARHFSQLLGRKINESTARRLKTEYLKKLQEAVKTEAESAVPTVKSLLTKPQGRPLLLGAELDRAVQEYVKSMRAVGGLVNSAIVMAAAEGIVATRDASKLRSNGGHIDFTVDWAKSILKRMGYVKRKCSNAGKVSLVHFTEIREVFLADVTAEVIMNDIPDELIINWDQTALQFLPTGQWTMHQAGEKLVPIAHSVDKRQITAVLAVSMTGEYLAPQLIYKGKTVRCHPQVSFPNEWDIWHTHNHWSNEETMKRYVEKIIVPFIQEKRKALSLVDTHPALVLYDCFRGQTTPEFESLTTSFPLKFHQIVPTSYSQWMSL